MQREENTRMTTAARGSLEALRREFERCSNRYLALYHELWRPHSDIPGHDGEDVGASFRKAFAETFGEGWQEWVGPDDDCYFGRFYGNGEGLREFRTLADAAFLVACEIDFRPSDLGKSSVSSFLSQEYPMLPEQGEREYDEWLMLLYRLGIEYPSPLLTCRYRLWVGRGEETPLEALGEPEEGAPYPLHPWHLAIEQPLFTASIAAIDILLDKSRTMLFGVVPSGNQPTEETESIAERQEGLRPPVLEFRFAEGRWRLQYKKDDGEIEKDWFDDQAGFCELEKMLSNPGKQMTPFELDPTLPQIGGFRSQDMVDDVAIDDVYQEIVSTEERLQSVVNPDQRRDLEDHLNRLRKYQNESVWLRKGKPPKKRNWPAAYGEALKVVGVRVSRARQAIKKKMPEFGRHLRRAGQKEGFFAYKRD